MKANKLIVACVATVAVANFGIVEGSNKKGNGLIEGSTKASNSPQVFEEMPKQRSTNSTRSSPPIPLEDGGEYAGEFQHNDNGNKVPHGKGTGKTRAN